MYSPHPRQWPYFQQKAVLFPSHFVSASWLFFRPEKEENANKTFLSVPCQVHRYNLFIGCYLCIRMKICNITTKNSNKFHWEEYLFRTISDRCSNQIENIIIFVSYSSYQKSYHHLKIDVTRPRVNSEHCNLPDERSFGFHSNAGCIFITPAQHWLLKSSILAALFSSLYLSYLVKNVHENVLVSKSRIVNITSKTAKCVWEYFCKYRITNTNCVSVRRYI